MKSMLHMFAVFDTAESGRLRRLEIEREREDELARKYADTESVPTDDLTAEWGEEMRADERERYRK